MTDPNELIAEWIRYSSEGLSPLSRHGHEWWRAAFDENGFIDARVREFHDDRPHEISITLGVGATEVVCQATEWERIPTRESSPLEIVMSVLSGFMT